MKRNKKIKTKNKTADMSWAKEEWKEGLTPNVLNKIHSLEDQNVQLKNDLKQKQFNCDSLQASVDKYVCF